MKYAIFVLVVRVCIFGLILYAAFTSAGTAFLWGLLALTQLADLLPKPQ